MNEETFINLFHEISIYLKTKPGKDITEKVSFTPTALTSKNKRNLLQRNCNSKSKIYEKTRVSRIYPTARLFNTLKAISATLHINKIKGKNQIIISRTLKKEFDKICHLFMVLKKLKCHCNSNEGKSPQFDQWHSWKNPKAYIVLNVEILNVFLQDWKIGKGTHSHQFSSIIYLRY